jgi:hypothetical protein
MRNISAFLKLLTSRGLPRYTRKGAGMMKCLVPWIAYTPLGKIVQRDGRHRPKAE